MLDAKILAPYVGFTQDEVLELSQKYSRDFAEVKRWYDGYLLSDEQVYNPEAVVSVMRWGKFQSYWSQTGTYESIQPLINRDFDGLRTAIITMLSGEPVEVRTKSYHNDMITFKNKDDVLAVLIHLGYLAYDEISKTAYIPNEEIRSELFEAVEDNQWNELVDLQNKSEKVLRATLDMDGVAVAEMIEEFHMDIVKSGCNNTSLYNKESVRQIECSARRLS